MSKIVIIVESTRYMNSREISIIAEMGFEVVYITRNLKSYSTECLINIYKSKYIIEVSDIYDYNNILKRLKNLIADRILYACFSLSEYGYYAGSMLAYLLSINGINCSAAKIFRSKLAQRNFFVSPVHFKTPKYQVVDINNFRSDQIILNFPLVVKPISLTASIGVKVVENYVELESAIFDLNLLYTKNCITDSGALLEEYISGKVISVESITDHGNHFFLGITDRILGGDK